MTYEPKILALDLAARSGWAIGAPQDKSPASGSLRFAREGASMAAVLAGCRTFVVDQLTLDSEIRLVVFEAPIDPTFFDAPRRFETTRQLIGLCSIVEECTYDKGLDVREANVSDVRRHFLGSMRLKRKEAKAATIAACRRLGWTPADDNAADALALWHYQASLLVPQLALQASPLFRRKLA